VDFDRIGWGGGGGTLTGKEATIVSYLAQFCGFASFFRERI
jgi:hypothetical protein